jgi:hypothetical protein
VLGEILIKLSANETPSARSICPRVISLYDVSHSVSYSGLVSNSSTDLGIPL